MAKAKKPGAIGRPRLNISDEERALRLAASLAAARKKHRAKTAYVAVALTPSIVEYVDGERAKLRPIPGRGRYLGNMIAELVRRRAKSEIAR